MNNIRIGKVTQGDMKANSYVRSEDEIGRITAELGRAAYEEFYENTPMPTWENQSPGVHKLWCRVALAVLIEKDKHV